MVIARKYTKVCYQYGGQNKKKNFRPLQGGAFGKSRGINRLKFYYLGNRAPITLVTLQGVTTSLKKKIKISFYSVLRRNKNSRVGLYKP